MNKLCITAALGLALMGAAAAAQAVSGPEHQGMAGKSPVSGFDGDQCAARIGAPAPVFTLDAVVGKEFKKISLVDYRGKWVVLFFYPNDFSFVCPTEIKGFNNALESFRKLNAEILGVSVDSKFSHLAWIERGDIGDLKFPLLSDVTREVSGRYGVLDRVEGTALRGLFIVDPHGVLQYLVIHNDDVGRSVEETLRVLEALQTGSLCPIGWKPGQKTIKK